MGKKSCLIIGALGGVAGLIFIILGVTIWMSHNRLVRLDEAVNAGWAQVETSLQRRYDLIPNLVNTVKGFAKQEENVLTEISRLRSQWSEAKGIPEKAQAANALEGALGRLMVVVERYPDLKSNQNFLALQDELAGTENRVSVERRRFNESVQQYNTAVRRFPGSLVASIFGFEQRDRYFKSDEGAATAPKVEF
jgi:LemA protein